MTMMMMWSEKHRPRTVQEMVGNEDARLFAIKWLAAVGEWEQTTSINGPAGDGQDHPCTHTCKAT